MPKNSMDRKVAAHYGIPVSNLEKVWSHPELKGKSKKIYEIDLIDDT
jgi:hypothetical protein